MKILMIGTWRDDEAEVYRTQAYDIGNILARNGHTLMASPSSGIQGLVAESYKQNCGKEFIGYYPDLDAMDAMGEVCLIKPSKEIFTGEDYPMRNLLQVRDSEGIIMMTGGPNTYCEAKPATTDYDIPVAYLKGSSPEIEGIMKIDKSFSKKINVSDDVIGMIEHIENYYMK